MIALDSLAVETLALARAAVHPPHRRPRSRALSAHADAWGAATQNTMVVCLHQHYRTDRRAPICASALAFFAGSILREHGRAPCRGRPRRFRCVEPLAASSSDFGQPSHAQSSYRTLHPS